MQHIAALENYKQVRISLMRPNKVGTFPKCAQVIQALQYSSKLSSSRPHGEG